MSDEAKRPEGAVTCHYCERPIEPETLMAAAVDTEGGPTMYFHGIDQRVYRSWECEQQAQVADTLRPGKRVVFFAPVRQGSAA